MPEDMFLGKSHKEVARPDDLVDRRDAFHAVRQRGDGLRSANAIDLPNAQLLTDRLHVGIVRTEGRRRSNHRQLSNAGCQRRNRRHQHRRRIGGSAARHADPHSPQRDVTMLEHNPWVPPNHDRLGKNLRLKGH